ncbi:MAG: hypothetical protein MET45_23860 [Nostoc sp. LLA-1]|nr:hypothetical protein [Cyanocohniella sp. LLY]
MSLISEPVDGVGQFIRAIAQKKTVNMALSSNRQKILKESGLDNLGFSIENSSIGESPKYKYTLVRDEKNTKRHLFQVSDSILLKTESEPISIITGLALTLRDNKDVNTQTRQKYYIFYDTTPHPIYETLKNTLLSNTNINIKFQDLKSVDDIAEFRRRLRGADRDDVIKSRLETLLDLKETPQPKICGDLITLQDIVEKLSYANYSYRGWEALLKYINPDLLEFFKRRRIEFTNLATEQAALEIINSFNRFGEDYGGMKSFLEVVSELSDLPNKKKNSIKNMLSLYFSEQSSSPVKVNEPYLLCIEERRELINIISKLDSFRLPLERSRFLSDEAKLDDLLRGFVLDDPSEILATHLICKLEEHDELVVEQQIYNNGLGALLKPMLDFHEDELGRENAKFVAGLIVRYSLISDLARLDELRQKYGITTEFKKKECKEYA